MKRMPAGFPLAALDRFGEAIAIGDVVRILAVKSCLKGLAGEDKIRLLAVVGQTRAIADIDQHGFVWLSIDGAASGSDFSLFPGEVTRALSWSGKKNLTVP
ncbi:MAG: hypothetical protein ACXWAC_09135 [Usitatibacter sp.]